MPSSAWFTRLLGFVGWTGLLYLVDVGIRTITHGGTPDGDFLPGYVLRAFSDICAHMRAKFKPFWWAESTPTDVLTSFKMISARRLISLTSLPPSVPSTPNKPDRADDWNYYTRWADVMESTPAWQPMKLKLQTCQHLLLYDFFPCSLYVWLLLGLLTEGKT